MSAAPDPFATAEQVLSRAANGHLVADTLWAAGHRAAALQRATHELSAALTEIGGLMEIDDTARLLSELGLSSRAAEEISLTISAHPPTTNAAMGEVHGQHFLAAQQGLVALQRAVAERSLTRKERLRARALRGISRIAAVALALTGVVLAFRPSADLPVRGSAYRSDALDTWPPENAVDADEMTYWHLPPAQEGYLDIAIHPPRPVARLRILNGHDLHADDRNRKDRRRFGYAAKDIRVTGFRDGSSVAQTSVTLPQLRRFDRVMVDLDAPAIDRIRIEIKTWYGNGGGLAEVEVLP
ncbi:MAG: hypothetical protein AAGE52_33180 [Myxococcota bacterium]